MNTGTPGSNTPPNPGITEAQEENESTSFVNILEVYSPPPDQATHGINPTPKLSRKDDQENTNGQ